MTNEQITRIIEAIEILSKETDVMYAIGDLVDSDAELVG